jgi:hypothetical protein
MSNYRSAWLFCTNFEGDSVKMRISGMKRKHLTQLSQYIHLDSNGEIRLEFENNFEASNIFAAILPECVTDFRGLVDFDKKQPIPFETVLEDIYFVNLVSEIIQQVLETSIMTKEDVTLLKKRPVEQQRVLRSAVAMRG